jgi:hypothetical protein
MATMRIWSLVLGLFALFMSPVLSAGPVGAQVGSWVQIEAQPDLRTATDRARAYAGSFPHLQGYKLKSGWYGIVIGPMSPAEAAADLATLAGQGRVPPDSFITDGVNFREPFWPETTAAPLPATEVPLASGTDTRGAGHWGARYRGNRHHGADTCSTRGRGGPVGGSAGDRAGRARR